MRLDKNEKEPGYNFTFVGPAEIHTVGQAHREYMQELEQRGNPSSISDEDRRIGSWGISQTGQIGVLSPEAKQSIILGGVLNILHVLRVFIDRTDDVVENIVNGPITLSSYSEATFRRNQGDVATRLVGTIEARMIELDERVGEEQSGQSEMLEDPEEITRGLDRFLEQTLGENPGIEPGSD